MSRVARVLPLALLLWAGGLAAFDRAAVPAALREWIPWVLDGVPDHACPPGVAAGTRQCVWPTRLALELEDRGGSFTLSVDVFQAAWVTLPGGAAHWPQEVMQDGIAAVVVARGAAPAVRLGPGRHVVSGRFEWQALPATLPVPAPAALLELRVAGEVRRAEPDGGLLYLATASRGDAAPEQQDQLSLRVVRLLIDEQPFEIVTRLELDVTGRQREVTLAAAQFPNTAPLRLDSALPARLEHNGDLRVQLRPGQHVIELATRHLQPVTALTLAPHAPPWPADEIWSFEPRPALRMVEVDGVPGVDPTQTRVPPKWQAWPAYRMRPGETLKLDVRRRGDPEPAPDQLSLRRELWLDFAGAGLTVQDTLQGHITRAWRLETHPALELGRVMLNGAPQAITSQDGVRRGVEVRHGGLELVAESRLADARGPLPAVGWAHDVDQLDITLHLPPGWRLWAAFGMDSASPTWVARWTLLDLFLVLVATVATARLWHWRAAALAGLTLALIWHEPAAPRHAWLHLLAAIALLRVLPAGRLRGAVALYRTLAALSVALPGLAYMSWDLRTGLFPQLEYPYQSAGQTMDVAQPATLAAAAPRADASSREEVKTLDTAVSALRDGHGENYPMFEKAMRGSAPEVSQAFTVDPEARVQTGPGLPLWRWNRVALGWRGPVLQNHEMSLWLAPPALNRMLAVTRVALFAGLCLFLLRGMRPPAAAAGTKQCPPTAGATGGVAALLALVLCGVPGGARAELPAPDLLEALKARLLAPPDCAPDCASLARVTLTVRDDLLTLMLDVQLEARAAVPLPGRAGQWLPAEVLDETGDVTSLALRRSDDGVLHATLAPGRHRLTLRGPLPARATVEIPFTLPPRALQATAAGWRVAGQAAGDAPIAQVLLSRVAREKGAAPQDALEARALPPFFEVERTLAFGLDWRVETRVRRLTPPGQAATLAVPLLAGEAVTQAGIEIAAGHAQLTFAAEQMEIGWGAVLASAPRVTLVAADTPDWRETWQADIAPIWHASLDGIAVVQHVGDEDRWLPVWRPLPGERVGIALSRPVGVVGPTLTLARCALSLSPGSRALDASLALNLRSSQAAQHALMLPHGATLLRASIDGVPHALLLEGRTLTVPLTPGDHALSLEWRQPHAPAARFEGPVPTLGLPAVNVSIVAHLPEDRWVLMTRGPPLGPAMLFWPVLALVAALALALGRSRLTPLSAWQWGLLGIGLSQTSVFNAALLAGWLGVFALRARLPPAVSAFRHNAVQLLLAALTLAALSILYAAIRQGLLGAPEMWITGNGSRTGELHWYQDQVGQDLPRVEIWSLPLWIYRVAMLSWSLWLAVALLGWLRWAWQIASRDGLWRPIRLFGRSAPEQAPPAPGVEEHLPATPAA